MLGKDINLVVSKIKGYRNFCNKVFQALSFVLYNLGKDFKPAETFKPTGKLLCLRRQAPDAIC